MANSLHWSGMLSSWDTGLIKRIIFNTRNFEKEIRSDENKIVLDS